MMKRIFLAVLLILVIGSVLEAQVTVTVNPANTHQPWQFYGGDVPNRSFDDGTNPPFCSKVTPTLFTQALPYLLDAGMNHLQIEVGLQLASTASNGQYVESRGSGATATATLSGNTVGSFTITNGGAGYVGATLYAYGGGPSSPSTVAVATAIISGGVITGANFIQHGSGYTSVPNVVVIPEEVNDNTNPFSADSTGFNFAVTRLSSTVCPNSLQDQFSSAQEARNAIIAKGITPYVTIRYNNPGNTPATTMLGAYWNGTGSTGNGFDEMSELYVATGHYMKNTVWNLSGQTWVAASGVGFCPDFYAWNEPDIHGVFAAVTGQTPSWLPSVTLSAANRIPSDPDCPGAKIQGPDVENPSIGVTDITNNFYNLVPGSAAKLAFIAFHNYESSSTSAMATAICNYAVSVGKLCAMTEQDYIGGLSGGSYNAGFDTLVRTAAPQGYMDLIHSGVSGIDILGTWGVCYFEGTTTGCTPSDSQGGGGLGIAWDSNGANAYYLQPTYYVRRQLTKYVKPGYVRIDATSTIQTVAWKRQDGGLNVTFANNTGSTQSTITVSGLHNNPYTIHKLDPSMCVTTGQFRCTPSDSTVLTPSAGSLTFTNVVNQAVWTLEEQQPTSFYNYSADVFGGLTSVSGSAHPHALTITSITQNSGSATQNVTASNPGSFLFAVNEPIAISGTGVSALDTFYVNNTSQAGTSFITATNCIVNSGRIVSCPNPITLTLTAPAVAASNLSASVGSIAPARYSIQTVATPLGTGPQFVDPQGHWQWLGGIGDAQDGQTSFTTPFQNLETFVQNKYLGGPLGVFCTAVQEETFSFINLNVNVFAPLGDNGYRASSAGNCPANQKLPYWMDVQIGLYSSVGLGAFISQPVHDIYIPHNLNSVCVGNSHHVGDFFDPRFSVHMLGYMTGALALDYKSPWLLGHSGEDTDFNGMPNSGWNFHALARGNNDCDYAMRVLTLSPLETGSNVLVYSGGQNAPFVFADPLIYAKAPTASPPSNCSIITPCTLMDFLQQKYSTVQPCSGGMTGIVGLNNCWGSNYDVTAGNSGFGSSGAGVGWTFPWLKSSSTTPDTVCAAVSTSCNHLFGGGTVVSPFSVLFLITPMGGASTPMAFDCPQYAAGCTGAAGTGIIKGPGTWKAGVVYPFGQVITDTNGDIELQITPGTPAGTAGGATPTWPTSVNCTGTQTTADGPALVWECLGPGILNTTISSWSRTSNVVTVNTAPSLVFGTLTPGSIIVISGSASGGAIDGTWSIVSGSGTTLTFNQTAANGSAGSGGLVSGGITYATGNMTGTLANNLPGGATITAKYVSNGWPTGHGIMDEDGHNTAWIGSNYMCATQLPTFQPNHFYGGPGNDQIQDPVSGTWQFVVTSGMSAGSAVFSATPGVVTTSGGARFVSQGPGVCQAGGDFAAPNANQNQAADTEAWLGQYSGQYFMTWKTLFTNVFPDLPYGCADNIGTWQTPPRSQTLDAAQQWCDWAYDNFSSMDPTLDPQATAEYIFATEHFTHPTVLFETPVAAQSVSGCGGNLPCPTTQANRATQEFRFIDGLIHSNGYNNTFQNAGYVHWSSHDFSHGGSIGQNADFGLRTSTLPTWGAGIIYNVGSSSAFGFIQDSNGDMEEATTAGTSGSVAPIWPAAGSSTCNGTQTTLDGTVTWTCLGLWPLDNLKDGHENVSGSVSCSPPHQAFTCGGQPANYPYNGTSMFGGTQNMKTGLAEWFTAPSGPPPGSISFNPTSVAFGAQPVGIISGVQTVTLTNTGSSVVTIGSVSITGLNAAQFSFVPATGVDCTMISSVAAGSSCNIALTFTPNSTSVFSASISVADNVSGSPQTVLLSGTGFGSTAPAPSLVMLHIK